MKVKRKNVFARTSEVLHFGEERSCKKYFPMIMINLYVFNIKEENLIAKFA